MPIYLTKAQAARLAALTLDANIGAEIDGDVRDDSDLRVTMVTTDHDLRHFVILPDGTYAHVT